MKGKDRIFIDYVWVKQTVGYSRETSVCSRATQDIGYMIVLD